jgi:hypothetical protein
MIQMRPSTDFRRCPISANSATRAGRMNTLLELADRFDAIPFRDRGRRTRETEIFAPFNRRFGGHNKKFSAKNLVQHIRNLVKVRREAERLIRNQVPRRRNRVDDDEEDYDDDDDDELI